MRTEKLYKIISGHYIVTDTRKIVDNAVFFALKGPHFNGNKFATEALEKGASWAIIDDVNYKSSNKTILVKNVLKSLQKLATYHRKQLKIPVIALTGSNGKTTTKELLKTVLSQRFNVTATEGNLNNHIGVPLTLLSMTPKTDIGIVEMGANHPNEIAFLCQIAQPNFGYITNFGKAHLEGFGTLEGVVKAKSELYRFLEKNKGYAFINTDDLIQVAQAKGLKQFCFSSEEIELKSANPFVEVVYNGLVIKSKLIGDYNYKNIVAAIAIGAHFGVQINHIKVAIELYRSRNNRSQIIKKGHLQIILDAYNANPTSMQLALDSFNKLPEKPKYLVLGDMFELGEASLQEHQNIIGYLEKMNFEKAYLIGKSFYATTFTKNNISTFKCYKTFKEEFKLPKSGIMLVKASRGMALERILN